MMKQSRTVLLALAIVILVIGSYSVTNTQNEPDLQYMTEEEVNELVSSRMAGLAFSLPEDYGGVTDHDALTGLEDDDHSQYLLQDGSEGLTGNWDVGEYDFTAKDITADEFYLTGLGNYTAWVESLIEGSSGSGGSVDQMPFNYLIFKSGSTIFLVNETGGIEQTNADADVIFNAATSTEGLIFVKNGVYDLNNWNPTAKVIIQGSGMYFTILNLTKANWSIDSDGDMIYRDLQFISEVDGHSHYVIDASVAFERVYFNIMAHTNVEYGLFKFRGGSDDWAEFKDGCRWNIGDGGGTVNAFFWWETSMDHLYVDDAIIEMVNASSYVWLFSTGSGTWVETIRGTNIEVLDWYAASTGTDSAIFWRNGYQVGTLTINGYKFRKPSTDFGGNNQQLNVNGPMAGTTTLTNLVMDYRSHFYAGFNDTILSNSILEGESTAATRTAFDFGVQGEYPKFGTAINNILNNATITFNTGYKICKSIGNIYKGSRLTLMDEDNGMTPAKIGDKHVQSIGDSFYLNDSDGTDLWKDWIQIMQTNTQNLVSLQISDAYFEDGYSVIEALDADGFVTPLNVTISHLVMESSSAIYPELINTGAPGSGRDGNVSIAIYDSTLRSAVPPLDNWNPILKGDKFDNVKWIDVTDGSIYRSEYMQQVRISSGTSSETVAHRLPMRGPESFLMVTPMSDLSTTCEAWWIVNATFTDSQYILYVGKAGIPVNTDDDVDFWVYEKLNP